MAVAEIIQRVSESDALPHGEIASRTVYTYRYTEADASRAVIRARGLVTGGSERYFGARGTLIGRGFMTVKRDTQYVNMQMTLRLR
jgi:hypothetical protein